MDLNRMGLPRIGNAFSRVFGLEDVNSIPTVAPEVMPIISINERPEFWALLGGNIGVASAQPAAVPGAISSARLLNPAGSGILAIVEEIQQSVTAITWFVQPQAESDMTALIARAEVHADMRRTVEAGVGAQLGAGLQCQWFSDSVAAPFFSAAGSWSLIGAGVCRVPWILMPGFGLAIQGNPVNTAMNVSIFWREKRVTRDELNRV